MVRVRNSRSFDATECATLSSNKEVLASTSEVRRFAAPSSRTSEAEPMGPSVLALRLSERSTAVEVDGVRACDTCSLTFTFLKPSEPEPVNERRW